MCFFFWLRCFIYVYNYTYIYIYTKNVLHCKKRKKEGDLDLVHYCARTYVKRFFFYANYMQSERNVGISFTVICGLLITWSFHNVGIWFNGRFNFEIIIVFFIILIVWQFWRFYSFYYVFNVRRYFSKATKKMLWYIYTIHRALKKPAPRLR